MKRSQPSKFFDKTEKTEPSSSSRRKFFKRTSCLKNIRYATIMATGIAASSLFTPRPQKPKPTLSSSLSSPPILALANPPTRPMTWNPANYGLAGLLGVGFAVMTIAEPASASGLPLLGQFSEPANALSLPTWAVHVSSVVEWITAMALVWQYGEKSGFESWKGLSWGMVPPLGGAFCACTWHFFYNSESLEVLVALQAALTVIGNVTMCIAAYRICKLLEERPKNL